MTDEKIILPIDRLKLGGEAGTKFLFPDSPEGETSLLDLGKLNVFVGPNNSGKSRLLRLLSAPPSRSLILRASKHSELSKFVEDVLHLERDLRDAGVAGFKSNGDKRPLPQLAGLLERFQHDDLVNSIDAFLELFQRGLPHGHPGVPLDSSRLVDPLRLRAQSLHAQWTSLRARIVAPDPRQSSYIPVLRGARRLGDAAGLADIQTRLLQEDLYAHQTLLEQFPIHAQSPTGVEGRPVVFTGYGLYDRIRAQLLGDLEARSTIRGFEQMLSAEFFAGQEIALIPREDSTQLHIKIGNEEEQPIGQIGDGVQQLIILTYEPFIHRAQSRLFFIEEPEIFLHPGMLRKLCEYWRTTNHVYFLATHSNHVLDLVWDHDDVRVFQVGKSISTNTTQSHRPVVTVRRISPSKDVLDDLGVRASSVFLANAVVWVEGRSDHVYLRRLVEEAIKDLVGPNGRKPEENLHYVFVCYGGANLASWDFGGVAGDGNAAERLCARSIVIADQDDSTKRESRDERMKAQLGRRYLVLEGREIENLLPAEVLWKVAISYETKAAGAQLATERRFKDDDYLMLPIGRFLQGQVDSIVGKSSRKGGYAEDSGTLKAKVAFANKAAEILTLENSGRLGCLARSIAKFIVGQNQM